VGLTYRPSGPSPAVVRHQYGQGAWLPL